MRIGLVLLSTLHTDWCRNNGVVMPRPPTDQQQQEKEEQENQLGLQPPVEMEFSPPPEQRDTIATQVPYMCRTGTCRHIRDQMTL